MKRYFLPLVGICLIADFATAARADVAVVPPQEIGLSPPRLERMTALFKGDIDKNKIPGAVLLVARNGKVG